MKLVFSFWEFVQNANRTDFPSHEIDVAQGERITSPAAYHNRAPQVPRNYSDILLELNSLTKELRPARKIEPNATTANNYWIFPNSCCVGRFSGSTKRPRCLALPLIDLI